MVEIKDKVVTVESLSTLHEHNKATYVTKENFEILLDEKFAEFRLEIEELISQMMQTT